MTKQAPATTEGGKDRVHSFPNGTVSVKMHKRKRLTLVVAREDLDAVHA